VFAAAVPPREAFDYVAETHAHTCFAKAPFDGHCGGSRPSSPQRPPPTSGQLAVAARRPIQPCSAGGYIWSSSAASAPPSAHSCRAAATTRSQLSSPRGAGGTAALSLRTAALPLERRAWTAERERERDSNAFWNRSAEVIASAEGNADASPTVRRRGSEAAAAAAAADGRARRPASSPRAAASSGVSAAVVDMTQCLSTECRGERRTTTPLTAPRPAANASAHKCRGRAPPLATPRDDGKAQAGVWPRERARHPR
jgi:hypothetical protein